MNDSESDVNNTVATLPTTTGQPMSVTVSSCLGQLGWAYMNFLHQISNLRLPLKPSYNRQFEINNSTVNIYNYSIMNPSDCSDNL